MLSGAPEGAACVLLDDAPFWMEGLDPERGEASEWHVGRAGAPLDAERFVSLQAELGVEAHRPLAPVHLRGAFEADGALRLQWTRRGRVDADTWLPEDIPLGEEREAYTVRVSAAGGVSTAGGVSGAGGVLERRVERPRLLVPAADLRALAPDGGDLTVSVAQIGTRVGRGHPAVSSLFRPVSP